MAWNGISPKSYQKVIFARPFPPAKFASLPKAQSSTDGGFSLGCGRGTSGRMEGRNAILFSISVVNFGVDVRNRRAVPLLLLPLSSPIRKWRTTSSPLLLSTTTLLCNPSTPSGSPSPPPADRSDPLPAPPRHTGHRSSPPSRSRGQSRV